MAREVTWSEGGPGQGSDSVRDISSELNRVLGVGFLDVLSDL